MDLPLHEVGSSEVLASESASDPSPHGSHPRGTRKTRCVKDSNKGIYLSFLDNHRMGEVLDTAEWVLVGHVRGQKYNLEWLHLWMMEIWGHFIEVIPSVIILPRGSLALSFCWSEHL